MMQSIRCNFIIVGFLGVVLCAMTGCAVTSHGRMDSITHGQVAELKIGETTKDDIIKLLGKPQKIMYKPGNMEVYVYSHGIERSIGIPFIITWQRAGGTGQTLNIIFNSYGVVVDYEYITDQRDIIE